MAIGRWAAWSAVSSALGPLVGGSLVDLTSWRIVFVSVAPLALVAAEMTRRAVAIRRTTSGARESVDYLGAVLATIGSGAVIGGSLPRLIEATSATVLTAFAFGAIAFVGFSLWNCESARHDCRFASSETGSSWA